MLYRSFNSFFCCNNIGYEERVDVYITSHYKEPDDVVDYDDLDYKPLIDVLTRNILPDDNPLYMRLICDAVWGKDDNDFVDIYVSPCSE